MKTLTKKQDEIYRYLCAFQRSGKPSPSISELSNHFGFRSTRSARDHLKAIEHKGFIQREPNKARSIRVLDDDGIETRTTSIPLLGSISAGRPENTVQNVERYIHVDSQSMGFMPNSKCYALRVTGDSMIRRGIYEGDIVIVDSSREPRDGDIVTALIDNETTLKTLVKQGKSIYLRPENENYLDLIPLNELSIQGIVRTIIRNVC